MSFDVDAAIVWAGPMGLMLAGDLARAKVSCAVGDHAHPPRCLLCLGRPAHYGR
jgi:2-polyprenyl-6-methoxyphenol hydroxylase-like FAD-dependent oxidoreductase